MKPIRSTRAEQITAGDVRVGTVTKGAHQWGHLGKVGIALVRFPVWQHPRREPRAFAGSFRSSAPQPGAPPNLHAGAPSSGVAQTHPFPPDGPRAHGVTSIIQRPDVSFPYTGMWS